MTFQKGHPDFCGRMIGDKAMPVSEQQARYRRKLRLEVLTHYSGGTPRCACCGVEDLEFLSIDHINGGGYQHRKEVGSSFYVWLRRHGFPEGYRVLCMNCNHSLGHYGYCPHQTEERI